MCAYVCLWVYTFVCVLVYVCVCSVFWEGEGGVKSSLFADIDLFILSDKSPLCLLFWLSVCLSSQYEYFHCCYFALDFSFQYILWRQCWKLLVVVQKTTSCKVGMRKLMKSLQVSLLFRLFFGGWGVGGGVVSITNFITSISCWC